MINALRLNDMPTSLRTFIKIIAGFFVSLICLVLILILVGVKLDLSHLRSGVEISAGTVLDRDVSIDGPVEVEFSFWPALNVSDVKIANTPGAARQNFLKAEFVRMKLGILPLLRGELIIADITAENVALNLESDAKGNPNWVFNIPDTNDKKESPTIEKEGNDELITFTGLDHLRLENINFYYHDAALNESFSFVLDSMDGTAPEGESLSLKFSGLLEEHKYDLELQGNSLVGLADWQQPWGFTLNGVVAGKKVAGKGSRVIRKQKPEIDMVLGVSDIDIGATLAALDLVNGMQASVGNAEIKATIRGDSLNELVQQSSMAFTIKEGAWLVTLPNSDVNIPIDALSGDILVEKRDKITMKLKGRIEKEPVSLLVTGAPLVEYVTRLDEVPLAIDIEAAKSKLSFSSKVKLPITSLDVMLSLKVDSERIDHLNNLLRLDLPELGPVSLNTTLHITDKGYEMRQLSLQVGDSQLEGELKLETTPDKPKLGFSLISNLIQLDDFNINTWQPAEDSTDKAATAEEPLNEPDTNEIKRLLSYEVLNAFDADILIESQQVLSGKDKLGSGRVEIKIKDAGLSVEPLTVTIPGGHINARVDFTPSPTDVSFNMKLDIEDFDVGVLARRAEPETDMGGELTLDVELHSKSPDQASIMTHANGHFDFALVPKNFSAGIIDLWAVNILTAVMDKSTEKDESNINCVVARLGMQEGTMKEKAIYLDTTKMFIEGNSEINFENQNLDIGLSPSPKKPEFFSLAIPIHVTGTFDDFTLNIGVLPMAGKLVSFITSPLHVPIQRIFTEEIPADGSSACKAAWKKTAEG